MNRPFSVRVGRFFATLAILPFIVAVLSLGAVLSPIWLPVVITKWGFNYLDKTE